jgi:hypothetical protein
MNEKIEKTQIHKACENGFLQSDFDKVFVASFADR